MILSYCCVFCGSQAQSKLVHIVIPCVRRSHRQQGHYSKTTESWCLGILSANIWTFISCCYSISPTYPTQGRGGGREAWESERKQALKNMPVKKKKRELERGDWRSMGKPLDHSGCLRPIRGGNRKACKRPCLAVLPKLWQTQ